MKNFVKPGKCLTWTNSTGSDIPAGQAVTINDFVFVTTGIIKNGEVGELLTEGVVRLAKLAGTAFNFGDVLYWDNTAKNLTKVASTHKIAGFCAESELSAATSCEVKLVQMHITPAA